MANLGYEKQDRLVPVIDRTNDMATVARTSIEGRLWSNRGMEIRVRGPDGSHAKYLVRKPFAWIGSDSRADVVLPDGKALPCHLYLHAMKEGVYCLGLTRSAPNGWMAPATHAAIGPYRIAARFDDDEAPDAPPTDPRSPNSLNGCRPRFEIVSRHGQVFERFLSRRLTIVGRERPSTLLLKSHSVSRVHCVVFCDGESVWAVDLLSRNGMLLDGVRSDVGAVRTGRKLTLGQIQLHYLGLGDRHVEPESDQAPNTLSGDQGQVEELAARLRAVEEERDGERARRQQAVKEQKFLADRELDRHREEALVQQTAFDQRLAEAQSPLNAEIAALQAGRDEAQLELTRSKDQIEELAARLRAVQQERDDERARRHQAAEEQKRLAEIEHERHRQEALAQQTAFDERLAKVQAPLNAEIVALRTGRDEAQLELTRSKEQVEELASRLRAVEQQRDDERAGRRQAIEEQERLAESERERHRQESLAQQTAFDQRSAEAQAPLSAEIDVLRTARDEAHLELTRREGRLEELDARLRAVEQERDDERARGHQAIEEQKRLAEAELEQLRQEALAQQTVFDKRLAEVQTPLNAEIDALRTVRDEAQLELTRSKGYLEELTSRLRAVEEERDDERTRRHQAIEEQKRLAEAELERLRQEALAQQTAFDNRLAEAQAPLSAEIDALRTGRDKAQRELTRSTGCLEELAAELRAVEQQRDDERARRHQPVEEQKRLADRELERLRGEALAQQTAFDNRLAEAQTPLIAEIDALRTARDEAHVELTRRKGRLEELAAELRAVDEERDERARRQQAIEEQKQLAEVELERLRQEVLTQQTEFDERLVEARTPLIAEIDALRRDHDQSQVELARSLSQVEESAARLRAVEQQRDDELARLRRSLEVRKHVAEVERVEVLSAADSGDRRLSLRETTELRPPVDDDDQRLAATRTPLNAEIDAIPQDAGLSNTRSENVASLPPAEAGFEGLEVVFRRLHEHKNSQEAGERLRRWLWRAAAVVLLIVTSVVIGIFALRRQPMERHRDPAADRAGRPAAGRQGD
jgi:pSer/pThr/pTyr-binding forkhead associated (FHA) protein